MALQEWIRLQLEANTKYFVFDGIVFDMGHALWNWDLAEDTYTQWASGHVQLSWSGFSLEYTVDSSLTGEALDQAAFSVWANFVYAKEVAQNNPSAWSLEDLPSNYVGFIPDVRGNREFSSSMGDIAHTLADFVMHNLESGITTGNRHSFGDITADKLSSQFVGQELAAAVAGVYRAKNYGLDPVRPQSSVVRDVPLTVSWQSQYIPPEYSTTGWQIDN